MSILDRLDGYLSSKKVITEAQRTAIDQTLAADVLSILDSHLDAEGYYKSVYEVLAKDYNAETITDIMAQLKKSVIDVAEEELANMQVEKLAAPAPERTPEPEETEPPVEDEAEPTI